METPEFDAATAHRHFSADCFNKTWEYIEKSNRTAEDDRQMLLSANAPLWHWTQREDCGVQQLSIGHWLLSRACFLLGHTAEALRHGDECLRHSETLSPFYKAYAREALSRVHASNPDSDGSAAVTHLDHARSLLPQISDDGERAMLEADLSSIKGWNP